MQMHLDLLILVCIKSLYSLQTIATLYFFISSDSIKKNTKRNEIFYFLLICSCARESVRVFYIFCCTPFGCCDQKWAQKASAISFYSCASSAEHTRKHTYTHTHTHTCCCRLRLRRLSQRWQRHVKMRQKSFHKQLLLKFSFKFRYFSCLLRSATTITNSNNNNYNLCSGACNDNALDL